MKKLHFKSILSIALMICLIMGSTIVCHAYDGNTNENVDVAVLDLSVPGNETATPLSTVTNTAQTLSHVINGPNYTTTKGHFGGSFTVPSQYNNHIIKLHWACKPLDEANSSVVFKMTVTGNGISNILYVPVSTSAQAFTIGDLPVGTYNFTISPHTSVLGSYLCVYQFYAY